MFFFIQHNMINLKLFFWFIYFNFSYQSTPLYIKTHYHNVYSRLVTIMRFGEKRIANMIKLGFSYDFSWTKTEFNENDKTVIEICSPPLEVNLNPFNSTPKNFTGVHISSDVSFSNNGTALKNFHLLLFNARYSNHQAILEAPYDTVGLASKYDNESFSLLHSLYRAGQISKLSFGLVPSGREKGDLYLGEIPPEIFAGSSFQEQFYVDNTRKGWKLNLEEVCLGKNNCFETSYDAYFEGIVDKIVVPKSFKKTLEKVIPFSSVLGSNACEDVSVGKIILIRCTKDVVKKLGGITFVLNGVEITLTEQEIFDSLFPTTSFPSEKIFTCFEIYQDFPDIWLLGNKFYSKFITVFDVKQKTVTLFSNSPFKKRPKAVRKGRSYCVFINSFVLVFGCLFLLIRKKEKF